MINFFEKHSKIPWLITILIAIFIFYISSISFEPSYPSTGNINSFLYHFFIFFFLAFFLIIALVKGKKRNLVPLAIIIAILYGISDEIHQLFVPRRYCSFLDILINSTGILFSGILYFLIRSKNFES